MTKTVKALGSVATLLKAASELPEIFTAEELTVAAWLKDKEALGLKGYESLYPNNNKVLATLMGKNGLERRGYFKKIGPKRYSLMPAGRALIIPNGKPIEARAHKEPKPRRAETAVKSIEPAVIPNGKPIEPRAGKELETQFLGYFDSPTKHKVIVSPETVAFVDALTFWGIKSQDTNINQKLSAVDGCLSNLEALLREKKDVTLSNGLALAAKDIQGVRRTHEWLQEKFRRHLNLLINRNR